MRDFRDYRMERKGIAHKILSVFLRLGQIGCSAIVLGILGWFVHRVHQASANTSGRIIYTMVVASLTILYSLLCLLPFNKLFMGFPVDFILFIMWLIAFCLLETRTGVHSCSATWYNNYWGYNWGRFWRFGPPGRVRVRGAGCGEWRSTLAFSFIACLLFLISGILGVYVYNKYIRHGEAGREAIHGEKSERPGYRHDNRNGSGVDGRNVNDGGETGPGYANGRDVEARGVNGTNNERTGAERNV